jgi:transcriptional regulator with XRE-family HTH domain
LQVAFGRAVRRERIKRGISQEQLALAAGINRGYMGDTERGERNVALRNMFKIAAALDMPLSRLVSGTERELRTLKARTP